MPEITNYGEAWKGDDKPYKKAIAATDVCALAHQLSLWTQHRRLCIAHRRRFSRHQCGQ